MVPTADLRNALDEISVKVLGVQETTAKIAAVTDTATGLTDGTLTIGDDILIEGENSKSMKKTARRAYSFALPTERNTKPNAVFRSISRRRLWCAYLRLCRKAACRL